MLVDKVTIPRVQRMIMMDLQLMPPFTTNKSDIKEGYRKAHTASEGEQICIVLSCEL